MSRFFLHSRHRLHHDHSNESRHPETGAFRPHKCQMSTRAFRPPSRVQYCPVVRRISTSRALIVILCVALVLALALTAGSHISWAVVALFVSLFVFPASGARFS